MKKTFRHAAIPTLLLLLLLFTLLSSAVEANSVPQTLTVPAGSYVTVENLDPTQYTRIEWEQGAPWYYTIFNADGTVNTFNRNTNNWAGFPAGTSIILEFEEETTLTWPASTALKTTLTEGTHMEQVTVSKGKMIQLSMKESASAKASILSRVDGENTTHNQSYVSFCTANTSDISFSHTYSSNSFTLKAGYTAQIAPSDNDITYFFPACQLERGLSYKIYDRQPLVSVTLEPNHTYKAILPANAHGDVSFQLTNADKTATPYYSHLYYNSTTYAGVGFHYRTNGTSCHLSVGGTYEITALDEALVLYYPSFFGTLHQLTYTIYEGTPLASDTVEPGKTLHTTVSPNAPASFRTIFVGAETGTSYPVYDYVTYLTDSCTGVSFARDRSAYDFSHSIGNTSLISPKTEKITFWYPKELAKIYGFTYTFDESAVLTSHTVPLGKTMHAAIGDNAPDTSVNLYIQGAETGNGFPGYDYVSYDTGAYTNVSYKRDDYGYSFAFSRNRTHLFRPKSEAIEFYYPALFVTRYGFSYTLEEDEILTSHTVPLDKTMRAVIGGSAPATSVNLYIQGAETGNGFPGYDYVSYDTGTYANVSYKRNDYGFSFAFSENRTHLFRPNGEAIEFYYPILFNTKYGFSYTLEDAAPIRTVTAAAGETLTGTLPSDAPGDFVVYKASTEKNDGYAPFDYVSYDTGTKANVKYDSGATGYAYTFERGRTGELSPVNGSMDFWFPAVFENIYGFTCSVAPGEPLTFHTIEPNTTLRLTLSKDALSSTPMAVRSSSTIYPFYHYLEYVEQDCSQVSYTADKNSHTFSLKPGYTTEISPKTETVSFYYPNFYATLYPFTTDTYEGQPITFETLEKGTILRVSAGENPLGDPQLTFRGPNGSSYPSLSYVKYRSDYTDISYQTTQGIGKYTLTQGYLNEIAAETDGVEFYFPTFYLDRYSMTYDLTAKGHPIQFGQVALGYTLRTSLSSEAIGQVDINLYSDTTDYPLRDRVTYTTADCSGLTFLAEDSSNYLTLTPGCSAEFAPCSEVICYDYPKLFETQFGLTMETPYLGNPITRSTIDLGYTLKVSIPAEAALTQASLALSNSVSSHPTHEYLTYVSADYSSVNYTANRQSASLPLSPGFTYEIAPVGASIAFNYPTVYHDRFGMTTSTYKGSPMTVLDVPFGKTLVARLSSEGKENLSLELAPLSGSLCYDHLQYNTEDYSNAKILLDKKTNSFPLFKGETHELTPTGSGFRLTYPTFYSENFGLSCTTTSEAPILSTPVDANETLTFVTGDYPADDLYLPLKSDSALVYDYLSYSNSDATKCDYKYHLDHANLTLKTNHTVSVAPAWETVTVYYPAFLDSVFHLIPEVDERELTKTVPFDGGSSLTFALPQDCPRPLPIALIGDVSNPPTFTLTTTPPADSEESEATAKDVRLNLLTLNPGCTYTLTGKSGEQSITACYPDFYKIQFGMSCTSTSAEAKKTGTVSAGKTVRFCLPVNASTPQNLSLDIAAGSAKSYYLMSYEGSTGKHLSTGTPRTARTIPLKPGVVYEITPVEDALVYSYPERYELVYLLDIQELDTPAMTVVELLPGTTYTASLAEYAPSSLKLHLTNNSSLGGYYSSVSFRTKDNGALEHHNGYGRSLTLEPGHTVQITPMADPITLHIPASTALEELGFGFTADESDGQVFQTVTVKSGDTLHFALSPDSAAKEIEIFATGDSDDILFDWVMYHTADKYYTTYGSGNEAHTLKAGYTLSVTPRNRSITFCYPAVLEGNEMTSTPQEGYQALYTYELDNDKTIQLARPDSSFRGTMDIRNLHEISFSYALYAADGLTCKAMSRDSTENIRLLDQEMAVCTGLTSSGHLSVPRFWISDGLLAIYELSTPALHVETIPHNQHVPRAYQLIENCAAAGVPIIVDNSSDTGTTLSVTDLSTNTPSTLNLKPNEEFMLRPGMKYVFTPVLGESQIYFPGAILGKDGIVLCNNKPFGNDLTQMQVVNESVSPITDYVVSVFVRPAPGAGAAASDATAPYPVSGANVTIDGLTVPTNEMGMATFEALSGSEEISVTLDGYRKFEGARIFSPTERFTMIILEPDTNGSTPYIMSITAQYQDHRYDLINGSLTVNIQQYETELDDGSTEISVTQEELEFLDVRVEWGDLTPKSVTIYKGVTEGKLGSKLKKVGYSESGNFPYLNLSKDPSTARSFYVVAEAADGTKTQQLLFNLDTILVEPPKKAESGFVLDWFQKIDFLEFVSFIADEDSLLSKSHIDPLLKVLNSVEVENTTKTAKVSIGLKPIYTNKPDDPNNPKMDYNHDDLATDVGTIYQALKAGDKDLAAQTLYGAAGKDTNHPMSIQLKGMHDPESPEGSGSSGGDSGGSSGGDSGGDSGGGSSGDSGGSSKKNHTSIKGDPEFSFKIAGYAIYNYPNQQFSDIKITALGSVKDVSYQFIRALPPLGYFPTFFSALFEASGEAFVGFGYEAPDLVADGSFDPKGTMVLTGGIGVPKHVNVSLNGDATLSSEIAFLPGSQGASVNASLDSPPSFKPDVKIGLDASIDLRMTLFSQTLLELDIWKGTYPLFPQANKALLMSDPSRYEALNMDTWDLSTPLGQQNLEYLNYDSSWLGSTPHVTALSSQPTRQENVLLSNLSQNAEPMMVKIGNTRILLWSVDNMERAVFDRTMLVWSAWNEAEGIWSEPQPLWDNGYADFYPVVQGDWIVWMKLNQLMGSGEVSIDDMSAASEIVAAHWNGTGFDTPVVLTENTLLDAQPVVVSDGVRTAVVWTRNSENNILGIEGINSILVRELDENGVWGEEAVIAENRNAIIAIAAGYDSQGLRVAFNEEKDNSLMTINDRPLNLLTVDSSGGVREQMISEGALEPHFISMGSDLALFFLKDDFIHYLTDLSGEGTAIQPLGSTPASSGYFVTANEAGEAALLTPGMSNGNLEIFGYLFDGEAWSPAIQLTAGLAHTGSFTGLLSEEGVLDIAYTRTHELNEVQNDGTEKTVYLTDLCTMQIIPSHDLKLDTPFYAARNVTPGSQLDVSFCVANYGELNVDAVQAHVYTEDGQIDKTVIVESSDLPVGTNDILSVPIQLPNSLPRQQLWVEVLPMVGGQLCSDLAADDNVASTELGGHDLVVSEGQMLQNISTASTSESFMFTTIVSNQGLDAAPASTVSLRTGSSTGRILAVQSLDAMSVGQASIVQFSVQLDRGLDIRNETRFYITVDSEGDTYIGNNLTAFYVDRPESEPQSEVTRITPDDSDPCKVTVEGVLANMTTQSQRGTAFCAVYSSDGQQLAIAAVPDCQVDSFMEATFSCQLTLSRPWSEDCTAKLLYLDSETLAPITKISPQ